MGNKGLVYGASRGNFGFSILIFTQVPFTTTYPMLEKGSRVVGLGDSDIRIVGKGYDVGFEKVGDDHTIGKTCGIIDTLNHEIDDPGR